MKVKICILCKKEILLEDLKYMIALEKPYLNLIVHRDCYNSCDNLKEFLSNSLEEYLNLIENIKK